MLWFPAARDSDDYTVGIQAVKGAIHSKAESIGGMVTMPIDGISAAAARADFPFEPLPEDMFLKGPASSGDSAIPDPDLCIRFRILTVSGLESESHWRIQAQRVA